MKPTPAATPRALDGICHSAHHGPVERFGERFEFIATQLREAAIAHKTGLRKHGEADLARSASASHPAIRATFCAGSPRRDRNGMEATRSVGIDDDDISRPEGRNNSIGPPGIR
jgi:hypothetical protein